MVDQGAPRTPEHRHVDAPGVRGLGNGHLRRRLVARRGGGGGDRRRRGFDPFLQDHHRFRGEVRQALQPFQAGDDPGRGGIRVGEAGADQRELERQPRRGRPPHVVLRREQQREDARQFAGAELLRLHPEVLVRVRGQIEQILLARSGLDEQQVAEVPDRLVRHVAHVPAVEHESIDDLEDPPHIPDRHHVGDLELHLATGRAEQGAHRGFVDGLATEPGGLVQQGERIARRAFGSARDRVRRGRIQRDPLGRGDRLDHLGEPFDREAPEVEPLAPSDDRGRHLVWLRGCEDEPDTGRRLLEEFQQRVEGLA